MKVCPQCGHKDSPNWITSRFDFNAEYCTFNEAPEEVSWVVEILKDAKNFEPLVDGEETYYRRGKLGQKLYRVPTCDYLVERERKRHDFDANQRVLFSEGFSSQEKSSQKIEHLKYLLKVKP